ncbi:MAG: hypothetical protein MK324_13205 [Pirellulales bacterium]|nr:hypothetical protein [Rhodopirellula sp.]MCH2371474.1 hypothetical protein [Pirellulales bacterium]
MQQIKIFKSIESELGTLEDDINSWMAEQGVSVVQIFGNIAPQSPSGPGMGSFSSSDVLVVVLYEL